MRTPIVALAALLLAGSALAPAARAQTAPPAGAAATASISDADRAFLVKDAQGGVYERALAELAQSRASRPDVKAYATKVVEDHGTANGALEDLATFKGVTLPTSMSPADQRRLKGMTAYTPRAFDGAFIKEAIRVNAEDKRAGAAEAARTQDTDIKDFLSKFSSMDADHERMALALRK